MRVLEGLIRRCGPRPGGLGFFSWARGSRGGSRSISHLSTNINAGFFRVWSTRNFHHLSKGIVPRKGVGRLRGINRILSSIRI
jgi:hypothetical protein